MRHAAWLIAFLALSISPGIVSAAEDNTEDDKEAADVVAVQVRDQGYTCDEPTSASREDDEDGDAVWRLDCQNATYRVRLVPDMAAEIDEID